MFLSEVRPERLGHPNFRIGRLPKKKIAQPHFAAGADEQVGIGNGRGVEMTADSALVNFDLAVRARLRDQRPHRVHDLRARAVIQRQRQPQARVALRLFDGPLEVPPHGRGKLRNPADDAQTDVLLVQFPDFFLQVLAQQLHQELDFCVRALPVFDGKSVKRQVRDAEARAGLHRLANRSDAGAMPCDAWQAALLRPAAVAVHNHGDVAG